MKCAFACAPAPSPLRSRRSIGHDKKPRRQLASLFEVFRRLADKLRYVRLKRLVGDGDPCAHAKEGKRKGPGTFGEIPHPPRTPSLSERILVLAEAKGLVCGKEAKSNVGHSQFRIEFMRIGAARRRFADGRQ